MEYVKFEALDAWRSSFEFDMQRAVDYASSMTDLLESEDKRLRAFVDERAKGMSPDEQDDLYDWWSDDVVDVSDRFPKILLRWHFVAEVSLLEVKAAALARRVGRAQAASLYADFKTNKQGLAKTLAYLKDACGVVVGSSQARTSVERLILLQNCIVHADGYIAHMKDASQQATLRGLSKHTGGLQIPSKDNEGSAAIEIGFPALQAFADDAKAFWGEICGAIEGAGIVL